MTRSLGWRLGGWLLVLGVWLLGCAAAIPFRYYTLSAMEGPNGAPTQLAIGVGPISFPDWLDRSQVVTRRDPHRIEIHDTQRWAGTLKAEFARVAAANLARLAGTERVAIQPWGRYFQPDYRVAIDVYAFEGGAGAQAVLDATWMLVKEPEGRLLTVRQARIVQPAAGSDTAALVAAQSQALAAMSRTIAEELLRQAEKRAP